MPWRRSATSRHVLLLSIVHGIGHGVACVVALQAEEFLRRGWTVTIGGPRRQRDRDYPVASGCGSPMRGRRRHTRSARVRLCDRPYAAVLFGGPLPRHRPLFYIVDHGEPPAALFENSELRETLDWEKRFCAPLAHRVFVIPGHLR